MPIAMTTINRTFNINKFYMSLFMAFLMIVSHALVVLIMWSVGIRRLHRYVRNFILFALIFGIVGAVITRQVFIVPQVGMSTVDFSRAMIEHHENAIFMARLLLERTLGSIPGPLIELAVNITTTQASEIEFMKQYS